MYNPNQFTGYQPGQFTGYQPNYYQQPYQFNQPTQDLSVQQSQSFQNNSFAWVQGEAGAKAYPVKPGTTAWLLDSENQTFYIKTVDQNGVPQPLEIYDYAKRQEKQDVQASTPDLSQYVRKDELKAYIEEILGGTNESTI